MSGSLTIPFTFIADSGNVSAGQLDTDYSTIASYINTREITLGTLGARPAASVSGRLYCATDTGGGTLYEDSGSAWTQIAGSVSGNAVGTYSVRNLVGQNDAGTPNTKMGWSADLVVLRNPTTGALQVNTNTGTVTNDTGVAGSTANGRDQAAAFGTPNFIHCYFIWNGTTLATLSSLTAPPTGPALPTGYTHWAYAGVNALRAGSIFDKMRWRGSSMVYEVQQNVFPSGASGVGENTVAMGNAAPPNALTYDVNFSCAVSTTETFTLRIVSGSAFSQYVNNSGGNTSLDARERLPNIGQQFFFIVSASRTTIINCVGYTIPNGGDGA